MKRRMLYVLSLFVLGALALAACGAKGDGGAGDGSHAIGDPVEVADKNLVITMDSGAVNSYKVVTTFTIENKGASEFAIDPKTTFVVSATSGEEQVPMELGVSECGSKMIKGPVPAGGKITGDICWRGNPTNTWPNDVVVSFSGAAGDAGIVSWKLSVEE
jgi:hypothetical protein